MIEVTNLESLEKHWPFLWHGFNALTDPKVGRQNVTEDSYKKMMLGLALDGESKLLIAASPRGVELGFIGAQVVFNLQSSIEVRIHVLYSNGKDREMYKRLVDEIVKWSYSKGINTVSISSGRINGSAMRFFETKLGFHRTEVIFKKDIL